MEKKFVKTSLYIHPDKLGQSADKINEWKTKLYHPDQFRAISPDERNIAMKMKEYIDSVFSSDSIKHLNPENKAIVEELKQNVALMFDPSKVNEITNLQWRQIQNLLTDMLNAYYPEIKGLMKDRDGEIQKNTEMLNQLKAKFQHEKMKLKVHSKRPNADKSELEKLKTEVGKLEKEIKDLEKQIKNFPQEIQKERKELFDIIKKEHPSISDVELERVIKINDQHTVALALTKPKLTDKDSIWGDLKTYSTTMNNFVNHNPTEFEANELFKHIYDIKSRTEWHNGKIKVKPKSADNSVDSTTAKDPNAPAENLDIYDMFFKSAKSEVITNVLNLINNGIRLKLMLFLRN